MHTGEATVFITILPNAVNGSCASLYEQNHILITIFYNLGVFLVILAYIEGVKRQEVFACGTRNDGTRGEDQANSIIAAACWLN